jgi:hypothetical protein
MCLLLLEVILMRNGRGYGLSFTKLNWRLLRVCIQVKISCLELARGVRWQLSVEVDLAIICIVIQMFNIRFHVNVLFQVVTLRFELLLRQFLILNDIILVMTLSSSSCLRRHLVFRYHQFLIIKLYWARL